jgi:hypothetical protein
MQLTFEVLTLSIISLLCGFFISLYFYFTRNFNFWKKLGIPYAKPVPFVGNVKDVMLLKVNIGKSLKTLYDDHSDKPYVGIFVFDQPILLVRDLDLVKNILIKDAQNFIDRIISFDENLDPVFGRGISLLKGQRWRQVRVNLTPVFTSAKMKIMFHLVEICGKELGKCLDIVTADGK